MRLKRILQSLHFGSDVAEGDTDLTSYFVHTSSFLEIINDEVDVLLGPKGSGKTAMVRVLSDPMVPIPELIDVDIVPAFNPQGSVIFRQLASSQTPTNEPLMRTAWFAYLIALAGNHLLRTYADVHDLGPLASLLGRAGLTVSDARPQSVWRLVRDGLRRAVNPQTLQGTLTFGPTGAPILTGSAEFDSGLTDPETDSTIDLEDILAIMHTVLEALDRRCWIVIDRLDEAFPDDRALERIALRGLLRAHLDLASYQGRLRSKIFLRNDVLDRITQEQGFVNATHMRIQRIQWFGPSIADLISKRITENSIFWTLFPQVPRETKSTPDRILIMKLIFPSVLDGQKILSWFINSTVDGSDQPNPRNVIALMRQARAAQLRMCDLNDEEFDGRTSLISTVAMRQGLGHLSQSRLEDTLFAEFPRIRTAVERFRGKQFRHRRWEVANLLELPGDSLELDECLSNLQYAGFVRISPRGSITIPTLYQTALGLQDRRRSSIRYVSPAGRDVVDGEPSELKALLSGQAKQVAAQVAQSREDVYIGPCRDLDVEILLEEYADMPALHAMAEHVRDNQFVRVFASR